MNFNDWTPEQRQRAALALCQISDKIDNDKNIKWLPKIFALAFLNALYKGIIKAISDQNDYNFPPKENN